MSPPFVAPAFSGSHGEMAEMVMSGLKDTGLDQLPVTMGGIIQDAGLTVEKFRSLL